MIEAQARGEVPEELIIPDALKLDENIKQTATVMAEPTSVEIEQATGVPNEIVNLVNNISQAEGPVDVKASTIAEILKVPQNKLLCK